MEAGCESILHYLDDFLLVGPRDYYVCAHLLGVVEAVTHGFGVPLAREKTEGPVTCLCFLGIELDSVAGECRLPMDKLIGLRADISAAMGLRKIRLQQLQSLLGKLNFACKIMPMGRVFNRRLAAATAGVSHPTHFIRLTPPLIADLAVWQLFLADYNGRSLWQAQEVSNSDLHLFTDAAGSVGFGAILGSRWCSAQWPEEWHSAGLTRNLAFLELFPILVAVVLWGSVLRDKKVVFHCDNMGVVMAINNLTASSPPVIRLLRKLVLLCLKYNISCRAEHITGVVNVMADALSRLQWDVFRAVAPGADAEGFRCPQELWSLGLEE
ncbi:uncharacterized protein RCH25_048954 [Pelodytes ibericus]